VWASAVRRPKGRRIQKTLRLKGGIQKSRDDGNSARDLTGLLTPNQKKGGGAKKKPRATQMGSKGDKVKLLENKTLKGKINREAIKGKKKETQKREGTQSA